MTRLLPKRLTVVPLATSRVRRLAIPVVPMSPPSQLLSLGKSPIPLLHLERPLRPPKSPGRAVNILLETQWSDASGQATNPVLQSPRVTESARLVAKLRREPVLPRKAARLQRSGVPLIPCPAVIPATTVEFALPIPPHTMAVAVPLA